MYFDSEQPPADLISERGMEIQSAFACMYTLTILSSLGNSKKTSRTLVISWIRVFSTSVKAMRSTYMREKIIAIARRVGSPSCSTQRKFDLTHCRTLDNESRRLARADSSRLHRRCKALSRSLQYAATATRQTLHMLCLR